MKKKQPSPAGVSDIPPLRTLAPPSGHPPRGLAVSCGDRLGGVVEWGDGEFREMFSWGHDGHDGHGGHGGHMMVALVVAIMDGGGHMDGGRHSGGGDWVRACGRGGGDSVLATARESDSDSQSSQSSKPTNQPTTHTNSHLGLIRVQTHTPITQTHSQSRQKLKEIKINRNK